MTLLLVFVWLVLAVPPTLWAQTVVFCDSEELSTSQGGPYPCSAVLDGSTTTFWHTEFVASSPAHPHEIQVDTGVNNQATYGFQYIPRQDAFLTGTITSYVFYVSNTTADWGVAVATGTLAYDQTTKNVGFPMKQGRYFRLVALAEGAALPYTSATTIAVLTSPPPAAPTRLRTLP